MKVNTFTIYMEEPHSLTIEQMQSIHRELVAEIEKDSDEISCMKNRSLLLQNMLQSGQDGSSYPEKKKWIVTHLEHSVIILLLRILICLLDILKCKENQPSGEISLDMRKMTSTSEKQ